MLLSHLSLLRYEYFPGLAELLAKFKVEFNLSISVSFSGMTRGMQVRTFRNLFRPYVHKKSIEQNIEFLKYSLNFFFSG